MSKIITISRQFGSGGARVGRAAAQRLGFQYADREILSEAARLLDVESVELEPLEERSPSIWARIGTLFAQGSPDVPFMPPMLPTVNETELFAVERKVIEAIAARGDAVIVGRGAAHVLGGGHDVVRVFLHAPLASRVALAMSEYGFGDRTEAERLTQESDRERARFAHALTGRDWCDATLYDLTLNTDSVGLDRVVDLIVGIVQQAPTASLPPVTPRTVENRAAR